MFTVIVLALIAAMAAVQDPQTPVFRSGTQIVEIDVRVFDRSGRFVADLTRDDFEVLEDGRPQRIETFFLVRESAAGPAPRPATPEPPPPPGSAPAAPAARQTWIFFFDLNHLTPGGGFDRAKKAVEEFIRDRFREGDVAGILAGDRMVNNRLTSVRQELLDGLKQVQPRADARNRWAELTRDWPRLLNEEEAVRIARNEKEAIQRAVIRACSDDSEQCQQAESMVRSKAARLQRDIHRASMDTMAAINTLANGLARIPGPKTVVFLSDGFPVQDVETTLRSVVGQTARAGARVYAIDVRGLGRVGAPDPGQVAAEDTAGPATKFDAVADAPNSLAVDTGGLMIRNENNIGRALDTIAADANSYYVLGVQPENTNWDGRFRTIEVRVKRDGVRVRARKGYLALEPARMVVPK
ncbi:MAG TPA: VWA domain-containing protein [Vicinamibacterales bacterium]|nr:VWA domain-containing protein [Vicinamibacterales bacterium]